MGLCKKKFICSIYWVNGEGEVYGPFHLFRTCLCIIRFAVFRSFLSFFSGGRCRIGLLTWIVHISGCEIYHIFPIFFLEGWGGGGGGLRE